MKDINIDDIFDYESTGARIKEICDYIVKTYNKENGYSSIPKEYYPFLYKLLTFRKYDKRGQYEYDQIRTFFVGKADYNNDAIMFYDTDGNCKCIGITKAIAQWQKEKNIQWEYEKGCVIGILRNISKVYIDKIRKQIKLPIKSELSGIEITKMSDMHIDHYDKDFVEVAFNWMYAIKKQREYKFKKADDTIHFLYKLIDEDKQYFIYKSLSKSFYDFHNNNTHLRIITKQENLHRPKTIVNWDLLKINGRYIEQREKESNIKKDGN